MYPVTAHIKLVDETVGPSLYRRNADRLTKVARFTACMRTDYPMEALQNVSLLEIGSPCPQEALCLGSKDNGNQ